MYQCGATSTRKLSTSTFTLIRFGFLQCKCVRGEILGRSDVHDILRSIPTHSGHEFILMHLYADSSTCEKNMLDQRQPYRTRKKSHWQHSNDCHRVVEI